MADAKLTDLTSGTAAGTDLIYAVKDPSGTPVDRKVELSSVKDYITAAANLFTTAQTISPLTDVPALTARSASGGTTNVLQLQDSSNNVLAAFDKDGLLTLGRGSALTGQLKFANSTNANVLTLQAGATSGSLTFTLPTADGTSGQVLQTNGSGVLSWKTDATTSPAGSDTQLQFNNSGSFGADSTLTFNSTSKLLSANRFGLSGNISSAAWTTSGIRYSNASATITDTSSSGTVATAYTNLYGGNTIAASNSTTFTNYYNTYIAAPVSGTNVTFTNSWALGLGGSLNLTAGNVVFAGDTILARSAAANLRLGADDTNPPVAQILSVQNATGLNIAGANLTINGSRGTGTGAGGSIIFRVAPAGSSGTSQNALATALTIDSTKLVTFAGNINMPSTFTIQGAGTTLLDYGITSSNIWTYVRSGGNSQVNIVGYGTGIFNGFTVRTARGTLASPTAVQADDLLGFSGFSGYTGTTFPGSRAAIDAYAAENWSDVSQGTYLIFRTCALSGGGVSERLRITPSGILTFGGGATSSYPALKQSSKSLQVRLADDSAYTQLDAETLTLSTDVILSRRGAANIRLGAADAAAPVAQTLSVQSVVASGSTNTAGVDFTITGSQSTGSGVGGSIVFQTSLSSAAAGSQNSLAERLRITGAGLLTFAGTTSSFPALKRSSTTLQVRLADDSADAPLSAANITSSQNITANGSTSVIGYATGSGGAVTQATDRTTGVTLNKSNGAITLVSAAGTTSWQTFTVTNSTVAATDTVIVSQKSGTDKNQIFVTAVAAGSFDITFATTGGTTTEQPVFNFAVIKAVAA